MGKRGASFSEFASLCSELEKISSNISLQKRLASYFRGKKGKTIKRASYLVLGQIGPKYEDLAMGFGAKTMVKILAKAFDSDEKKVRKLFKKKGDLGDAAKTLSRRKRSSLKLKEVLDRLRNIQKTGGEGSQEERAEKMSDLLQDATAEEAKFIVRIALENMRLGVGEMTVLEAFAEAFTGDAENKDEIENSYNVCTDIGELGESLAEHGMKGAKRFSISLGRPVKVMLAQRVDKVSDILEKIKGNRIAAEEKYDGERVEIHKDGKQVQLFSRRLEDISDQYPEIAEGVRKRVKAKKAVLDGEIVAYKNGRIQPFQKLMQRRRKYDVEEYRKRIPVAVFLFDVLYVNGKSFLKKSYPERRKKLESIVSQSSRIKLAGRKVSANFNEIKKFFQRCVDKGLEGIIVKSTAKESVYQPGNRGWLWIKWKKEYAEGMKETIDVVVVGSYHGRGRRKGGFGALLCAVLNKGEDRFETFTKVGTGFTDKDFESIGKKLRKLKARKKPKRLKVKKDMEPDIYYNPRMVIEVLGAEITRSPSHTAGEKDGKGLALRFPRFLRVREDKGPEDITTVREVGQIRK